MKFSTPWVVPWQKISGGGRQDFKAPERWPSVAPQPTATAKTAVEAADRNIYRCSVMLVSGRYAVLNDGMGFSLVPWNPVIE